MTRSKSALSIIIIGFLILHLTPYSAAAVQPSTYRVLVDDWYGFYKVSNINNTPFTYENQTLNINAGDTVIWVNDASNNYDLTILSMQNLWDNSSGYLKYNYRSFNYTFTKPGTYEIYVKEYPRRPHQTIIVAPVETPTITTPPPTPTQTGTTITTTSMVTPIPAPTSPGINLWYILVAFIIVAGIVVFALLKKK